MTTVTICTFKRKQKSKTERGIILRSEIGEGDLIIDKNNKPVPAPIWNYDIHWSEGTLPVELSDDPCAGGCCGCCGG